MKAKVSKLFLISALTASMTLTATAIPINITVDNAGNWLQDGGPPVGALSLASNAFYETFVGGVSNDKAANLVFLQGVIANWNGAPNSPTLNPATSSAALPGDNGSIGDTSSYSVPAGYEYVVFHFGNGNAGAGGGPHNADENGWWSAWYLGGEAVSFTLPQEGTPLENLGGFSSARYFNLVDPGPGTTVPEGGTTVVVFGLTLLGIAGARRMTLLRKP